MTSRILIIEVDEAILKFLRRGLAYEGYQVDTAKDGAQAGARCMSNPPDLVLMDINIRRRAGSRRSRNCGPGDSIIPS